MVEGGEESFVLTVRPDAAVAPGTSAAPAGLAAVHAAEQEAQVESVASLPGWILILAGLCVIAIAIAVARNSVCSLDRVHIVQADPPSISDTAYRAVETLP